MIISKQNLINKQELERPLIAFIEEACSADEASLTEMLNANLKWDRPRGDLLTWVKLLNHFDEIFEKQIKKYELDKPHPPLKIMSDADCSLVTACLNFTDILLEHCINRNIYASSERVYQLISTPTIDVRLAAMEVAVRLGERYVASTYLKKYSASREVRQRTLELAKFYPPPVPTGFIQKQAESINPSDETMPRSEHYSLIDTLDLKKLYPKNWASLNFHYYATPQTQLGNRERGKKDKKGRAKSNHDREGMMSFNLCESSLKKLSFEQVYNKASEILPPSTRFAFSLAAQTAKAFNSRSSDCIILREKLLRIKCAAVSFIALMCNVEFTSSNLFEAEPYLLNFLADFLSPENESKFSKETFYSVLKSLEAIARKRQWGSELVRNLGCNVSHGLLFQHLRLMNTQVTKQLDGCFERGNLLVFTLIGHFIDNKSLIPRLASGGILSELMSFLNVQTRFRWTCSAAVNTIALFLRACPEYISDFITLDGFNLLINTINYEVDFAIENPDFGGGPPNDVKVYYEITLRQVNFLRNILRLCSQLVQADGSDRMRNLFDSSILHTFKRIIENSSLFGPPVVSATLDAVLYIIHNEPTAFSILKEAGVINSIIANYEKLFMPSNELQMALLEVLGAIALNKDGLKRIIDSSVLETYFGSFYDLSIAKELVRGDMSTSIGVSMDELGRHFTDLKPIIAREIRKLIEEMSRHANKNLEPAQFYPAISYGVFYEAGESEKLELQEGESEIESWESAEGSALIENLFGFLSGLLQDSTQWVRDLTEDFAFSHWSDYITLPRAPIDYVTSNAMTSFMNLLKFLEDENENYGLSDLVRALFTRLSSSLVQDFINCDSSESYFACSRTNIDNASKLLRELNAINNILLILTESYLLPNNMVNEKYQAFIKILDEIGNPLIKYLVQLMGRSVIEEIAVRLHLLAEAIEYTAPVLESYEDVPPVQVFGRKPKNDSVSNTWTDPRFKNTLQVRFLAYRFQHNIALILSNISRSCTQKRQDFFSYDWRRAAVSQTRYLAVHLDALYNRHTVLECEFVSNYQLVTTNLINFVSHSKDKGREVYSTALVLCFFFHTNLMSRLTRLAIETFNDLLNCDAAKRLESKNLSYVHNSQVSIKNHFVNEVLSILTKVTDMRYVPRLPFTHLFFNKKYCPNENAISECIVSQATLEGLILVQNTIGTKSTLLTKANYETYDLFPLEINMYLVDLVITCWKVKPIDEFYTIHEDRGTPAYAQIQYLMGELLVTQEKAIELLRSMKTNDQTGELDEKSGLTTKDRDIIVSSEQMISISPIMTLVSTKIKSYRETEGEFLFGTPLVKLNASISGIDREIALLINENSLDLNETMIDYVENLTNVHSKWSLDHRANTLRLLGHIFSFDVYSNDIDPDKSQIAHIRFLNMFVMDCLKTPSIAESAYLCEALQFLQPVLSKTLPNSLPGQFPYFKDVSEELKRSLLDVLLSLDTGQNFEASLALCKVLYLFAKDEKFKPIVASSTLVKKLIHDVASTPTEKATISKELAKSAILLLRVCFEDLSTIESVFSSEIVKSIKKLPSGKKDFKRLLDESHELVSRNPSLFINTASKLLRIENYNGQSHHSENVFLVDYGQRPPEHCDDIDMNDSENYRSSTMGLMHFLLSELMLVSKEDWSSSTADGDDDLSMVDKKRSHIDILMRNTLFAYLCFLLQTITELLGSYKHAKLEFITYSKKGNSEEKSKPRSTSLNFFIHQLNPSKALENLESEEVQRIEAVSSLSKLCLLALVSSPILENDSSPDFKSEDVDLAIVRRFFVDVISRVLKDSVNSLTSASSSYAKLYDLFDLCSCLLSTKFREMCFPLLSKNATKMDHYFIACAFIERQLPNQIAAAIADIDLNYPNVTRLIKAGIKPLTHLAKIKLTFGDFFESNQPEREEEEIVSDDLVDRDETPDLFRNSTLGMYDADSDSEEDIYDDGEPLEVVMSASDMSQEDEESESDDMDEEDIEDEDMEGEDIERGELEGYDSGNSDDDIEIIDELNLGSHSGESEEDISDVSEFYGFDEDEYDQEFVNEEGGDEEIEYDDAELDGWLDTFENDGESEEDASEIPRLGSVFPIDSTDAYPAIGIHSEEDDHEDSEGESDFESDMDEFAVREPNSATREFMTSIFDVLRPALRQQNVPHLLEGLVNGRLRNSFHITGTRGSESMLPGFDRAFEVVLNDRPPSGPKSSINHVFIRSTIERWVDAHEMFFSDSQQELNEQVRLEITKRIRDESYEIHLKLNEEKEKARRDREEKTKKKREEARLKQEEERRQREMERQHNPQVEREPVMLRIGDREVDISGTDIDPEFFEALPDDMREEVFTQHIRERRANANSSGTEVREIDPDFLEALPDQIRDEILQQEAMARRFSSGRLGFLEVDDNEDSELEDDADDTEIDRSGPLVLDSGATIYPPGRRQDAQDDSSVPKRRKTFSVPLVDKAGVASIIRLLFVPQAFHQRTHIYSALSQNCNNKQTRAEVMSLLIAILNDALHSQKALEKLYSLICGRAKNMKPHDVNLKKSLPIGATPVIVGIQLIEAVYFLLEKNIHSRYYLLTENENIFVTRRAQKKKLHNTSYEKYPINFLLKLLENPLLREQHMFIDLLASVLHIGTRPLLLLKNKENSPSISTSSIPELNLRLIVRILCSNECANSTFRRTISAMQNLSVMKNAHNVFSDELSDAAIKLSVDIVKDLKFLSTELQSDLQSSTDSKMLSKFTAPSSHQAKLLRILTALDYMYENRTIEGTKEEVESSSSTELTGLYEKLELGRLWDALSTCLTLLEKAPQLLNIATALLPLIEALMVVCKHSKVKDILLKDVMKYEVKRIDFTKEPIESLFFSFTDEHKKILNQMVRTNPNLMSGPFGMLVRNPRVLEFDNKKNYFDRQLHEKAGGGQKLSISIRRDQVFLDSYRALFFKSVEEFRKAKLEINFKGESGIDAGGVTREWYQVLSRQMFNPDYALFSAIASDETTFHPNRTSYVNPEHLSFFKFIGRIIGKAIFDGSFLDCHFSRAVYKKILDRPMSLKDMETLDLEYFKSLMWMLDNDITDIITEDFSVESDDYGEHKIIDLIPNGRNVPVTEENKHEYVRLVVEYRLLKSVEEQMNNFSTGFHEIIPKDLVAIFDEQELELLISGLPDIDVGDWQANTSYNNYSPSSEQIQWFWRAVKSFDNEERAKLLQFATGTSKVPLNGFKELRGASGTCKFSIHRDYGSTDRLPSSHTCFNQIDLPAYESYETLRGSLLLAITEGHEGFGMA